MSSRFGHDFDAVRIHTGEASEATAEQLGAKAYTVGEDIVFGSGQYRPETVAGCETLAHELAHVVQQKSPGDVSAEPSLEADAERAASQVVRGERPRVTGQAASGTVQLSPLSDRLSETWSTTTRRPRKGAIFDILRAIDPPGSAAGDLETLEWLRASFGGRTDDYWLAKQILRHGPEPLWPLADLEGRNERARSHGWRDEPGHIEASLGRSGESRQVQAFYFPGTSPERALILGGVHGSELSGVEVAEMLIEDLRTGPRPYYTVIIVPRLFPDTAHRAEGATRRGWMGAPQDSNIGRHVGRLDPNRNFPAAGQSLASASRGGNPVDAEGRAILPENVMLMGLINRFRPSRIASVHAKRMPDPDRVTRWQERRRAGHPVGSPPAMPGIFADPHTVGAGASEADRTAAATATAEDADLALRMARQAQAGGARVPGNWLGDLDTSLYGAASHQPGVSLGTWGPRAIAEGGSQDRSAMTVVTVEVQHYSPSWAFASGDQASRRVELEAHRDALREIFLGPPP